MNTEIDYFHDWPAEMRENRRQKNKRNYIFRKKVKTYLAQEVRFISDIDRINNEIRKKKNSDATCVFINTATFDDPADKNNTNIKCERKLNLSRYCDGNLIFFPNEKWEIK